MSTMKRKRFRLQQKVAIVRRHLCEGIPVSDLCDEHGIHPTVYYRWQNQLFENGAVAFERLKDPVQPLMRRIAQLETKLTARNAVISELMEEQVKEKRELGDAWTEPGPRCLKETRLLTLSVTGRGVQGSRRVGC